MLPANSRALCIQAENILQLLLLLDGTRRVTCRGLPADSRLVALNLDPANGALSFLIASNGFNSLLTGTEPRPLHVDFQITDLPLPKATLAQAIAEGAD